MTSGRIFPSGPDGCRRIHHRQGPSLQRPQRMTSHQSRQRQNPGTQNGKYRDFLMITSRFQPKVHSNDRSVFLILQGSKQNQAFHCQNVSLARMAWFVGIE